MREETCLVCGAPAILSRGRVGRFARVGRGVVVYINQRKRWVEVGAIHVACVKGYDKRLNTTA